MEQTDVAIVGGGPAGLMLAIELGCRGIRCMLFEEDADDPGFPKANATSSRTMEHYRRRGFADQVRAMGLTADHPQDIVYCTRLAGAELTRFRIPSRDQAARQESFGDYGEEQWPTPELPHRGQQMYIEPLLRRQAEKHASVSMRMGWRVASVREGRDLCELAAVDVVGGSRIDIQARYVVGCDGPRSLVRKTLGIRYSGRSDEERDFFGGQMLSVYFRSPDLYDVLGKQKAWQYWAVNAQQRCLLIAIDGLDKFLLCLQLKPGQAEADLDYRKAAKLAVGAPFTMNVLATAPWLAGYMLVADHFGSRRCFIAGDAAHLFTPSGGMGYNTSIDDAVNLGWKLAAVLQGWAGPELLDSYESERRPIALRNTGFARTMADSIGNLPVTPALDEAGREGDAARRALAEAAAAHVRKEFNIPGLQLGLRYSGSAIVASEVCGHTPDEPNRYLPTAAPGHRAPHVWVGGKSIFDLFARDFTLLCFGGTDVGGWLAAAAQLDIPLALLRCEDAAVRTLYGADLVLIRPDHHVAWRGSVQAEALAVLAQCTGQRVSEIPSPAQTCGALS